MNGTSRNMNGKVLSYKESPLKLSEELNELPEERKISLIADKFRDIMLALGLNLEDDSLQGTPHRVAKMYVKEVFKGLDTSNKPNIKLFKNSYNYHNMLMEKNINVKSFCEHHFVPIIGKAHVAYFPGEYVIGLSKLNRIVDYYSRRPQVQERLTNQIAEELKNVLQTEDIAIVINAEHMCVSLRGVEDDNSSTTTSYFGGKFKQEDIRKEFLNYLKIG